MDGLLRIIAIDPGDEHTGVAVFFDGHCQFTITTTRVGLFDGLGVWAATFCRDSLRFDAVVMEEFRLYSDKAAALTGSHMETVEIIGAMRERCRREDIEFVTQPAAIKRATKGMLRQRGIALIGGDIHARDAEVHGYYYLMANERRREKTK